MLCKVKSKKDIAKQREESVEKLPHVPFSSYHPLEEREKKDKEHYLESVNKKVSLIESDVR